MRVTLPLAALLLLLCTAMGARAAETHVAVAANFTDAAKEIGRAFAAAMGHRAVFSFGSTGQLYTQIAQGAPFEVFLAADQERPEKAETEGLAVAGSRFTYATGRLVLYSRYENLVAGPETLKTGDFTKLAIANPATAPYGAAAVQAMRKLEVYEGLEARLVLGTSIAQAFQFVETGNAELGFVALSQLAARSRGSRWEVPEDLHEPIAQDAVLLGQGQDSAAAKAFLDFLRGEAARATIRRHGYGSGG